MNNKNYGIGCVYLNEEHRMSENISSDLYCGHREKNNLS